MKKKYIITLEGCDDSTVFTMELDDKEKELVEEIMHLSKEASTYQCMPVLCIGEAKE